MAESKKAKKSGGAAKARSDPQPAQKPVVAPKPSPIDTNLAASAAARMVAQGATPPASAGDHHESSAFKKLKESLSKPSTQGITNFIQSTAPTKKGGQPFAAQNQMKRGQTFGADVNRSGVPRRTGG
jgi:hypothetical protein